jgi:apolipoprotein N-acyltransferase
MNELRALDSLGLSLPSPAYLFGAVVFGLIGLSAYRLGKRTHRPRTRWLGVALMLYPYAISLTWLLYAVGAALCVALYMDRG